MVNVTDMQSPDYYPQDLWATMYELQGKLHEKYKNIEQFNQLGWGIVSSQEFHTEIMFSFNNPRWQYYIKDMMWRVTEELCEADEAIIDGHTEHAMEEYIDALHFQLELHYVLAFELTDQKLEEYTRQVIDLGEIGDETHLNAGPVIYYLGLAANCLKNKPWKQTHVRTDIPKFTKYIHLATAELREELRSRFDFLDRDIYDLYTKKRRVNEFRIESKY